MCFAADWFFSSQLRAAAKVDALAPLGTCFWLEVGALLLDLVFRLPIDPYPRKLTLTFLEIVHQICRARMTRRPIQTGFIEFLELDCGRIVGEWFQYADRSVGGPMGGIARAQTIPRLRLPTCGFPESPTPYPPPPRHAGTGMVSGTNHLENQGREICCRVLHPLPFSPLGEGFLGGFGDGGAEF